MKIGIFDSGKGGTTIYRAIKKILPSEEYLYVADSKNCPYGEKTDEELMKIVTKIVDDLKEWGAEIIVIACNTATTRCIERLRKMYPELLFVGTEPAIKQAARSNHNRILVMATPGTIESERTKSLLAENKKNGQTIKLLACPGLADTIENGLDLDKKLDELLSKEKEYDAVVLGCTHYSLIKDEIQKFFPNAELVDGCEGVARQVEKLIKKIEPNGSKYNGGR
ncbi:glutamate racemase [Candidatus Saccharibacteria bacterium]|nr:glutamate racemase [Candidatus Saccharibacteria bacterium]